MTGSITIAGKEHISAIRASKKIGYSADYIGQLCRTKKIPATLIGKTWYVDYDALVKYKKGKKNRVSVSPVSALFSIPKTVESVARQIEKVEPAQPVRGNISQTGKLKILNNVVIAYEKEDQPRLPEISKYTETLTEKPVLRKKSKSYFIPLALSLMILFGFSVTRLENVSFPPLHSLYNNISSSVAISPQPALLSSIAEWFDKFFKKADQETHLVQQLPDDNSNQTSGIVVVPANNDHDGVVSRIKSAFSDEVEVSFDQSGDTGMITPVFREEDDFENYAFVIVPLKSNSNNN